MAGSQALVPTCRCGWGSTACAGGPGDRLGGMRDGPRSCASGLDPMHTLAGGAARWQPLHSLGCTAHTARRYTSKALTPSDRRPPSRPAPPAENVGAISVTGVASRRVTMVGAAFMLVFGLIGARPSCGQGRLGVPGGSPPPLSCCAPHSGLLRTPPHPSACTTHRPARRPRAPPCLQASLVRCGRPFRR